MLTLENIRRLFDSDYLQGARYDYPAHEHGKSCEHSYTGFLFVPFFA